MDAAVTWFTNGNSLIQDKQRYAGAAVVSDTKIIWTEPLLAGMSAQRAGLASLTKALELRKDKGQMARGPLLVLISVGLFMRGLLTTAGRTIKNKEEFLSILRALQGPKKLAIILCQGRNSNQRETRQNSGWP